MPIPLEQAKALVEAWAALDRFPYQKPAAIVRLAQTLADYSVDLDHAKRTSREFSEKCPRPADIVSVARRTAPPPSDPEGQLAYKFRDDPVGRMRYEFTLEVERAFRENDSEALDYYRAQQPEIVASVARKMGLLELV